MRISMVSLLAAAAILCGCSAAPRGGLGVPEPISPKNGSTFDHYPRTTELTWTAVPGAASYSVEVDCFHCCEIGHWCLPGGRPRIEATRIMGTAYRFSWVGANLGRWRVWAVALDGTSSEKSAWQDFLYSR